MSDTPNWPFKSIPVLSQSDLGSVAYFWLEKSDLDRCLSWPEIAARYPELAEEWAVYKKATSEADARFGVFFEKMRAVASEDPNT